MDFRITGQIRERESGLAVLGLIVRAYDKDLLHDDLLGSAITDENGRFEICYSERDFRELFDARPDLYLAVYLHPCRFLLDTQEAIHWAASSHEHFDLSIPQELLGDHSPSRPDDEVTGGMPLRPGRVRLQRRGDFDVPTLPGFIVGGPPGAPALPQLAQLVALPLGGGVLSFEVIPGDPVRVADDVNPMPVQEPIPGPMEDPKRLRERILALAAGTDGPVADSKYLAAAVYPQQLAELEETTEYGPLQLAIVRLRPVQYVAAEKCFLFFPKLRYRIRFDAANARRRAEQRSEEKAAMGEIARSCWAYCSIKIGSSRLATCCFRTVATWKRFLT